MHAWGLVAHGAPLEEIDLPRPEPRGTEVLVEVTHCGLCHSDLHLWEGFFELGNGRRLTMAERGFKLPMAMGHEIVGRVVAWGADAVFDDGTRAGDRRIVYPWVGCGLCARCLAREDNLCPAQRAIGLAQNGGHASHVLVPHPRFLVDPGGLDPAMAATLACSGLTVYSAVRKIMPLGPAQPVVLFGAGGLGLAAIGVLRALGHRMIVVADIAAGKRDAAMAAGAAGVVDGAAEDVAALIVAACGEPPHAAIDLVNSAATAATAMAVLRKGGVMVQVGLFGGALSVPLPMLAMRDLTIRGSYTGSLADLRAMVGLAQGGGQGGVMPALPIKRVGFERVNQAMADLRDGRVTGRIVLEGAGA